MKLIIDYIKEGLKVNSKSKIKENNYAESVEEFCDNYDCKNIRGFIIDFSDIINDKLTAFLNIYNKNVEEDINNYIEEHNPLKTKYLFFVSELKSPKSPTYIKLCIECCEDTGELSELLANIIINYNENICQGATYHFDDKSLTKENKKEIEKFIIEILEYIINYENN